MTCSTSPTGCCSSAASRSAFRRTSLDALTIWTMSYGIGAAAIIWWEAAEWLVQELGTAGLDSPTVTRSATSCYSSTGGALGAAAALWFTRRTTP